MLCFAVFLGGSGVGPSSLNVGYTGAGPAALSFQQPGPLRPQPNMGPGPARVEDTADDYTTPNRKCWRISIACASCEVELVLRDHRKISSLKKKKMLTDSLVFGKHFLDEEMWEVFQSAM